MCVCVWLGVGWDGGSRRVRDRAEEWLVEGGGGRP